MSSYCYALVEFERWEPELRARLAQSGITPCRAQDAAAYSRFPTCLSVRIAARDERDASARLMGVLPFGAQLISPVERLPAEPGEDLLVRQLEAGARRAA